MPVLLFVLLVWTVSSPHASGATPQSSTSDQSEPATLVNSSIPESLLQQASTSVGLQTGAAVATQVAASGTVTYNWAGKQVPGNISVLWNSSTGLQVTSETAVGTRTQTADWKTETMTDEKNRVTAFGSHTAARTQLKYFPPIELAAILSFSAKELTSGGTTVLNGAEVDVLPVAGLWPTNGSVSADRQVTLYIDRSTHLIIQRNDLVETAPGFPGKLARSIQYSDYRKVDGVSYPFAITETLNGQTVYSITFISISAK